MNSFQTTRSANKSSFVMSRTGRSPIRVNGSSGVTGGGGGGGGTGTEYLASDWSTATGTTVNAHTDGGYWDELYGQPTNHTLTLNVVTAGSTPAAFARTPNVLRITQRGALYNGTVQKLNILPLNANYYGQMFVMNSGDTSTHNHPLTQNLIGGFQSIPFGLTGNASNWFPFIRSLYTDTGGTLSYPFVQFSAGNPGIPGNAALAHDTWYRYRWRIEIVTTGAVNSYRIYPQVYTYNNSSPTALGTLLHDSNSYFQQDTNGSAGQSMQSWYNAGNAFGMPDPALARNVAFGQEGSGGAPDTGNHWYIANLRLWSSGWAD